MLTEFNIFVEIIRHAKRRKKHQRECNGAVAT